MSNSVCDYLMRNKINADPEVTARYIVNESDSLSAAHSAQLTKELRIFPSPWHWCVHGQGLGQQPTGFDARKAALIIEISAAVKQEDHNAFHVFAHSLLQDIVVVCSDESTASDGARRSSQANFYQTLALLPNEVWQYARACAVLTDSLVKLGKLKNYNLILRRHMDVALRRVEALTPETPKGRYEQLHLLANLFLASGQAGWIDLLTSQPPQGISRIYSALRMAEEIPDLFYRSRVSAILMTVIAALGFGYVVHGERVNYLRNLLDAFDGQLEQLSMRGPDGVHANFDYCLFPLSLTLNAIAVLGQHQYLNYRKDWVQLATDYFSKLAPASRVSQMTFYVHALRNLGQLEVHVPNLENLLIDVTDNYLQTVDEKSINDYLRCTYLVQITRQLGYDAFLKPEIGHVLQASLTRIIRHAEVSNGYGAGYMVAAYTYTALNSGNSHIKALLEGGESLPTTVSAIQSDANDAFTNLPKLDLALINVALQLRSTHTGDTDFFNDVLFVGE